MQACDDLLARLEALNLPTSRLPPVLLELAEELGGGGGAFWFVFGPDDDDDLTAEAAVFMLEPKSLRGCLTTFFRI